MLNEILRQSLIIFRGIIVFLQCNPLIVIGASAAITLFTTTADLKNTATQLNKKRAASTVGATLATGTVTVAAVTINEYQDSKVEERLREKKEAYEATTSWLDSLTDEQLAAMSDLVDKRIEAEEQKENGTQILAEQPKELVKTYNDDRKMM